MPTTQELADRLLLTAPEHEGWSIVESSGARGGYEELQGWASEMTLPEWRTDLKIRRPHLGLILLWLESEVARRMGGEGSLWPVLSNNENVAWHPGIRSELFNGQHATQQHRELLQKSARYFGLRHTFDEDEGHNWFRLIYLQFGFTHNDAVERLSPWLSGAWQHLPISVQRLLGSGDPGAIAFQQLWRSLRMFRLGNLPKAMLESRLLSNPWVLPEWCGDLVAAAKRSSAQILEVADLDAAEVPFFTAPLLAFSARGTPYFTTSLCNLSEIGLESEEYELKTGGNVLARLIRQPDGTYFSDASEAIRLPIQPAVPLSLVGKDGEIAGHDEAVLWDSMEEVSVYSKKIGLMVPPGQKIRSGVEIYLIASADIQIRPASAESFDLGLGYHIHRIASGWGGPLEAVLGDDIVWSSAIVPSSGAAGITEVTARFKATLDLRQDEWSDVPPPWNLPIQFHIPQGWSFVRLRWRRRDGNRVELNEMPAHITLVEMDAVKPLVLRVRIRNGDQHRTDVLRMTVPFVAALKWSENGKVYHHKPGTKLLLREAGQQTWSFSLPQTDREPRDPRTCTFIEGGKVHGRLKSRPSTLPDFGGYGASLRIADDPYQRDVSMMDVSPCVLDGGVLGNVSKDPAADEFLIRSYFTDLGPEHHLSIWYSNGDEGSRVATLDPSLLLPDETGWRWKPTEQFRLHGVALDYRGCRLGAWFDVWSFSKAATEKPPGGPSEVAALLRAWKAPVLQDDGDHFHRCSGWLKNQWAEILPVWLSTDSLQGPQGFEWPAPPITQNWQSTVGELLLKALPIPDSESAAKIVKALSPGAQGIQALGGAVWRIAEVCPILAARVVRPYLKEFASPSERASFFNLILACPDLSISEDRGDEIGKTHGNRDGFWLQATVPSLRSIEENGESVISHAYRLLSKSKEYQLYALGRWLREIRTP